MRVKSPTTTQPPRSIARGHRPGKHSDDSSTVTERTPKTRYSTRSSRIARSKLDGQTFAEGCRCSRKSPIVVSRRPSVPVHSAQRPCPECGTSLNARRRRPCPRGLVQPIGGGAPMALRFGKLLIQAPRRQSSALSRQRTAWPSWIREVADGMLGFLQGFPHRFI